jgi:hypothetical protein
MRPSNQITPAMHIPTIDRLSIELAALDVDAILTDSHAQVLHSQHCASLASTLSASAISRTLYAKVVVLCFCSRVFAALCSTGRCCTLWTTCCTESAHGVVACGVGRPDAGVLVGVGSNVGDELLCCERKETGEVGRCVRRRWQAGTCAVVVGNCVGNLALSVSCRAQVSQSVAYDRRIVIHLSKELP